MTSNKYNHNSSMVSHGWEPIARLPLQGETQFVAVDPGNSNALFIGINGKLYASFNQGKDWKQLLGLGWDTKMNRLYFDDDRMFLLTSEGLYESRNQGNKWNRIFRGQKAEKNALSLSRDPYHKKILYLGTEGGLFQSQDNGRTWRKETNELARQFIHTLEVDRENKEVFIASEKGLYRAIPRRKRLDLLYVTHRRSTPDEIEAKTAEVANELDLEIPTERGGIQAIVITHDPFPVVAIGTGNGVFISEDEGNHWERLPLSGLRSKQILDLVYSITQETYFASTDEGVYIYHPAQKSWNKLQDGLPLVQVNRLAIVPHEPETLYAATSEGLYQIILGPEIEHPEFIPTIPESRWKLAHALFAEEPTIAAIQKQAIRYANVSNWKTRRWQWASRFRALIPTLSAGKSFSTSDTIDLDRGGSNDPDRYIIGPPDQSKSWDFDLNWNLSDLIWNSSQTSIDSREKLMVELREDILSEVTRLYFERRRAQVEFILRPPADPLDRTHELLRIEELTASIDVSTGGYLTKELNKLYSEHPEFKELWQVQIS
ncbi:MAG: hypothetical protein HY584_04685 [Candidatus Omnitrophica bacterium]|nr:hypothetical protein [Candidatus Omnitrophota bacterium]